MFRKALPLYLLAATLLAVPSFAQPAEIKIKGLGTKVSLIRDARSVPYITAASENDVYLVQGYVTASDRLWQMDMMRRVARGETAELFGSVTLEEDKRWRRLGFASVARDSLNHLSPELRSALQSYADGVNAYIDTLDENTLPIEFKVLQYRPKRWSAEDSMIIGKILADALSSTWRLDLLKASLSGLSEEKVRDITNIRNDDDVILFGSDAKVRTKAVASHRISDSLLNAAERLEDLRRTSLERAGLFAEELAASNNWVISGSRTADGRPLLANDPHLRPTAPGIWYLTHLEAPGMRIAGVTFPGVPGIVLGHNDRIAWGATNVGPDVQDLYLESIDDKGRVKTAGGSAMVQSRKEIINVRVSPFKTETNPTEIEIKETANGPIILEEAGKAYSLKWTARDPRNNDFAAFYLLNRAKNWKQFRDALSTYAGASQNFVYADVDGNIGWQVAGAIPIRRKGDGSLPYDAATADGDWTGMIPFAELPSLFNPASGFIVTANQRIVGEDYRYPQLVREFAPPWRARRLFDLINSTSKSTTESVSAAQFDSYNIPVHRFAKLIVAEGWADSANLKILGQWDGQMLPESQGALLANELRDCLARKIGDENKGIPVNAIRERILHWAIEKRSATWLPKAFVDYGAMVSACDQETTASLTSRFGADRSQWVWGKVSVSRFPHPLAAAPLIGGQFRTPAAGIAGSGQTPNVGSGVSMRFIATPGNWDDTKLIIPLGQSGDPKSKHFSDQFEAYKSGGNIRLPFSRPLIETAAAARTEFVPY